MVHVHCTVTRYQGKESPTSIYGWLNVGAASQLSFRNFLVSAFQTANSFNLLIKASDHGSPQLSSTATVTVTVEDANNHLPVFTSDNVRENIITSLSLSKDSSVLPTAKCTQQWKWKPSEPCRIRAKPVQMRTVR